jgi:HAD superfamily hydrolase (TIGR01549 family)
MNTNKHFKVIKAIFFDVGDTLYSNEALEKEYPRQLYNLLAKTEHIEKDKAKMLLKETTEKLKHTERHVTKVRAMKELGFTRAQVHEAFCKVDPYAFLSPDSELNKAIKALSNKYKLGVISNFKRSHLLQILDALGLEAKHFSLMVTEDIVEEIKPAPEPFEKAVELSGFFATECLYVGDSPTKDMRPAKEVGMMTILVKSHPDEEQMKHADGSITTVEELLHLL